MASPTTTSAIGTGTAGTPVEQWSKFRSFLVCFAAGNLCFIRRWYDIENLQAHAVDYYRVGPPNPTLLIATLISGLLLSIALWLAMRWVERHHTPFRQRAAQVLFLALLAYPLESVRRYWNTQNNHSDFTSSAALLMVEALLIGGLVMAAIGRPRVVYAARRAMSLLVWLYPALVLDFAWGYLGAEPPSAYEAKPSLPPLPARPGVHQRVIWIVFDELDRGIAIDARPANLPMPELDRLRAESFDATRVERTARWTVLALPSLLGGRLYAKAEMVDADELRLSDEHSAEAVNWSDQSNVFREARKLGVNSALVGWHHPYCRVLGDSLVRCFALPSGHPTAALLRETHATDEGVWRTVAFLFRLQWENVHDLFRWGGSPGSDKLREAYVQDRQQQQYFRIRDRVYATASDRQIDFLFAHFPTPHQFAIYNRARGDFQLSESIDYLDNLALVDRTLGELRRELERDGLWNSTTLLVTADHGLRPEMWRGHYGWSAQMEQIASSLPETTTVPFLVKFGGNHTAMTFKPPFSAVITGDLCLAILKGDVSSPQEAGAWLESRSVPSSPK